MGAAPEISEEHLPAIFREADRASIKAQQSYSYSFCLSLVLVVVSATATSWAVSAPEIRNVLSIAAAVALIGGLFVTMFILQTQPKKHWFAARSVAESVKTTSWRYMMAAEPYENDLEEREADAQFCEEIKRILGERTEFLGVVDAREPSDEQITQMMREVRHLELLSRKDVYLRSRIREQHTWYGSKAATNARRSKVWIALVGLAQFAGASAAIALVRWPDINVDLTGVFASVAAAFMAWLQVKQYHDLAHSYRLAAIDLGLIQTRALHIKTDRDLSLFVADAETAISREHTMWVARRDKVV